MNIEEMLYECCKLRGNPEELIHRTIHEFNWFCQNLIFEKEKIINDKHIPLTNETLIGKIQNFRYKTDFLKELVTLFYEYCQVIYEIDIHQEDFEPF